MYTLKVMIVVIFVHFVASIGADKKDVDGSIVRGRNDEFTNVRVKITTKLNKCPRYYHRIDGICQEVDDCLDGYERQPNNPDCIYSGY